MLTDSAKHKSCVENLELDASLDLQSFALPKGNAPKSALQTLTIKNSPSLDEEKLVSAVSMKTIPNVTLQNVGLEDN